MASTVRETPGSDGQENPEMISGGHLVAKALKAEGVDVIFTLCGGHIIDIYDGCVDEGIDVIDVRHEQVAAHAADGYARITGKPGVAVVTAGPGTTDAVTGVANALRAESPMLLIGGQGALSQHKMGSLQDLPHVDMMNPITKFAATVPSTERAADWCRWRSASASSALPGRPSWRSRATCWTPRSRWRRHASPRRAPTARRPGPRATRRPSSGSPTSSWAPRSPACCSAARYGPPAARTRPPSSSAR
nr:thiamine pyrophosphate-binding protein [Actinophytocola sp.]